MSLRIALITGVTGHDDALFAQTAVLGLLSRGLAIAPRIPASPQRCG